MPGADGRECMRVIWRFKIHTPTHSAHLPYLLVDHGAVAFGRAYSSQVTRVHSSDNMRDEDPAPLDTVFIVVRVLVPHPHPGSRSRSESSPTFPCRTCTLTLDQRSMSSPSQYSEYPLVTILPQYDTPVHLGDGGSPSGFGGLGVGWTGCCFRRHVLDRGQYSQIVVGNDRLYIALYQREEGVSGAGKIQARHISRIARSRDADTLFDLGR